MLGLVMDIPLLLSMFIEHAAINHGEAEIVSREANGDLHRYTYAAAAKRIKRLARALQRMGIAPGARVGTLSWNNSRHFEIFYGVTGIGAVLHTINARLFPDQIVYMIEHAEDEVLFVDPDTVPLAEAIAPRLQHVRAFVLMASEADMPAFSSLPNLLCYETLLAGEDECLAWPQFDERSASIICYTSGTTGSPKGVVYSHRSTSLQTMAMSSVGWLPAAADTRQPALMPLAPMFHVNGWNFPFIAPYIGAKLVLPGRDLSPAKIYELIESEQVTIVAGVPTMWLLLTDWLEQNRKTFSSLQGLLSAGMSMPRELASKLHDRYGLTTIHSWGMTEAPGATSGMFKSSLNKVPGEQLLHRRTACGSATAGMKLRLIDDQGREVPCDGTTPGHLRVRGPWVASAYFKSDGQALDADGWLQTGDIATIDPEGCLRIVDRAKDVIKSGGEWISSVTIENAAMSHPGVLQAAVIGVAHPTWQERPLLVVVKREGSAVTGRQLLDHIRPSVAHYWLPDAVEFVEALPLTGTGKVSKAALRERFSDYQLPTTKSAPTRVFPRA